MQIKRRGRERAECEKAVEGGEVLSGFTEGKLVGNGVRGWA